MIFSHNEKIDIWKIDVPQVSRLCHTHDYFIKKYTKNAKFLIMIKNHRKEPS